MPLALATVVELVLTKVCSYLYTINNKLSLVQNLHGFSRFEEVFPILYVYIIIICVYVYICDWVHKSD